MNYFIKQIIQPMIDASTLGERRYVIGEAEIEILKYSIKREGGYFETSEVEVLLSHLPKET